jgi:hypothetical protein
MFVCVWEQREPLLISQTVTNYFFLLFAPKMMKNKFEWEKFDHQLLIYLNCFLKSFFCTWLICMASIYHQFFYEKWNPTSQSKSPNTYNFENCSKLKTSNFEQWQFFILQPNVIFKNPKDPPWNPSTTSPSQIFQTPMFYMTLRQVCESWSLLVWQFWSNVN